MENKKLKIIFLSFYSGEVYRGVETYVHNLANQLVKSGHTVIVYQNGPRPKDSQYETVSINLKINWKQKSNEGKRVLFPDYWAKLIGKFTKISLAKIDHNIDIILPTNGSLQVLYTRLWSWRHKVKMVISGQSGPGWDDRWNLWMLPEAFVAKTLFHQNWAKKANPFIKIAKVSNGVDYEKFSTTKSKLKLNLPKPIILSAGALVPIKRHHLTITAVSKLKSGSLVIAGKGDLLNELTQLGDKLLPGRFKILNVSYDRIPLLYEACDVLAFPTSPWESFGMVLLEAMATGLPVVATNDPIRKEIVGNAGILVDPTNIEEYSKAINLALNKKWGDIPQKQAQKFSWDKIALRYEKIFFKL